MSDILICDGSNLFMRAYYSNSDTVLQNCQGQDTTAIYVFLKHLRHMIETESPSEVYIIFDLGRDAKKRALHGDYKANRGRNLATLSGYDLEIEINKEESKKRQKDVIIDMLKSLPIKLVLLHQVEGDSTMAYIARHFSNINKSVLIVSNDQDFYQLLSFDGIEIWNAHTKSRITKANYQDHMKCKGISLESMLLYKCINGDTSDNIKGIDGLGEKRIPELFSLAPVPLRTVEDVIYLTNTNPIANKKFGKKIAGKEDILRRNYELMNLIEINFSPQSLLVIMKAIEARPSLCKMSFLNIMTRENIYTVLSDINKFLKPMQRLLE